MPGLQHILPGLTEEEEEVEEEGMKEEEEEMKEEEMEEEEHLGLAGKAHPELPGHPWLHRGGEGGAQEGVEVVQVPEYLQVQVQVQVQV